MKPGDKTNQMVIAGILTWVLPGAGHWYLGQKRLATIFGLAIILPFLTGIAVGGVKTSVNPYLNRWLFLAEMGTGGLATGFLLLNNMTGDLDARQTAEVIRRSPGFQRATPQQRLAAQEHLQPYIAYYPASDIAQIYLAVAGLLNLLAILDAMTRAQTGGLPVYYHELAPEAAAEGGG